MNNLYWRRRAERLSKQLQNGAKVPTSRVIRLYRQAFGAIDDDIKRIETARDTTIEAERQELQKELARLVNEAPDPITQNKILRVAESYNFRIDRAELVKARAYTHLMKVAGRAAAILKPYIKNAYLGARYGTIDDTAEGLNCGIDFSLVPERTLEKIITAPFHGKNYSQRVWDNTAETAAKAQKILTKGLVKGESYAHMARELENVTNNTYYNAYRLIQNETTHYTELGRFDAYKDMGIERYTYYATLGAKTCDVCASLDGKTFDIGKAVEGKNMPPIHPHCMCYTVIGDVKLTSRYAKDPITGKGYKVRGDMTYNEWKESLTEEQRTAVKAYRNRHTDKAQYNRYIERLGKENVPKSLDLFQKMKYNDSESWNELKGYYRYKADNTSSSLKDYKCAVFLKENGIKGSIHIPPKQIDIDQLFFDNQHINNERKHNVSETEAKEYIKSALVSITKRQGLSENYYSKQGISYVNPISKEIKTAFKSDEFTGDALKIMEVLNQYGY